jgi:peptide/nickel transport system permease protein
MAATTQILELEGERPHVSRIPGLLRLARRKYTGTISMVVIIVFAVVAITAQIIAPYDPLAVHTSVALRPPNTHFIMGTDELGRDIFSRLIYGARVSLFVGFGSVAIGTVIGIILGLTSAYFGGSYDLAVQRFIDALQSFPPLVLAMVMVTTLGPSVRNVILAIAITGIATRARVVRGTALSLMQNTYVDAARALGCSNFRIMMRYILPNSWAPIIVISTASLGVAIIAESSLSFLGLGPPPPTPTWGAMLSGSARSYMSIAPWLALAPGIAITLIVLAFNLLGDTLRDVLDPRLRGGR